MAKFLNTSGTTYHLEELIKKASDRLILISPYLKLNERIKELLEDKNRLKIDIRVIYGKSDLQPEEINWLRNLEFVRTSFCKNLHAKCYLNENECIITSLNLYEFSQVNNNEMGIFINKEEDIQVFKDAYEEAQRIIRISDEVRISLDEVKTEQAEENLSEESTDNASKLTSSKLAAKHKLKTSELLDQFVTKGLLTLNEGGKHYLTDQGKAMGGEFRSSQYGGYFLWIENMSI